MILVLAEFDFSSFPLWVVLVVFALGFAIPPAIQWARGHGHPEVAAELELANKVIVFLSDAITKKDHTGTVTAHVVNNAEEHGVDEHPAVKKIVG